MILMANRCWWRLLETRFIGDKSKFCHQHPKLAPNLSHLHSHINNIPVSFVEKRVLLRLVNLLDFRPCWIRFVEKIVAEAQGSSSSIKMRSSVVIDLATTNMQTTSTLKKKSLLVFWWEECLLIEITLWIWIFVSGHKP